MDIKPLVITLGMLALPAVVFFFVWLKRRQDEIRALIESRFEPRAIVLRDPLAYLVAQESRGLSQRRGNGNLILTEDELFLALALPRTVISIPLDRIGRVERVSRMCAQQLLGRNMLKIHYTDERGEDDALGVRLKQMDRWEAEIQRLRSRSPARPRG